MIIGPRGSGKTHILSFIYKTLIKEYADGTKLKVVRLSEEERGLTSLLDFLIACLRACNLSPEEIAGNVTRGDAVTPSSAAEDMFRNQTGNIPTLILIENLSDIFRGFKDDDLLDLRGFFQTHPNISITASSVSLYKSSSKPDHPFYGFFNIHTLIPLDRKNTRLFMATLAEVNEKYELAKELRHESSQAKVNAIYDLTGGNHRLLSMLVNVLEIDGLAELVGPFVQMIDRELTPYYQQRLDRLTPQQNKILNSIADHHGTALTVKEIAYFTFLTSQVVSRQLFNLSQQMFLRREKKGRESFYELNEPLLRIMLDMKEGRDRPLPLIVNFLRYWYEKKELSQLEKDAPTNIRVYYHTAIRDKLKIEREVTLKEQLGISDKINIEVSHVKKDESLIDDELKEALTLYDEAYSLYEQRKYFKSNAIFNKVIEQFEKSDQPELLEMVARAHAGLAFVNSDLNNYSEALAEFEEAQQISPNKIVTHAGCIEMLFATGQVDKALIALNEAFDTFSDFSSDLSYIFSRLINRFNKNENILKYVVNLFVNKGQESLLVEGTLDWLQGLLPMSDAKAKESEGAEKVLKKVLADVSDAQTVLEVFVAVRQDAMGEKKALMSIPLELRRLIEAEKNE